jgi:hypothetical protein
MIGIRMSDTWHFQLMKHEDKGEVWYGVHESYPTLGSLSYTVDPVTVEGESADDIRWYLNAILSDIDKYGVINYE